MKLASSLDRNRTALVTSQAVRDHAGDEAMRAASCGNDLRGSGVGPILLPVDREHLGPLAGEGEDEGNGPAIPDDVVRRLARTDHNYRLSLHATRHTCTPSSGVPTRMEHR
jgi:hypothetical protein